MLRKLAPKGKRSFIIVPSFLVSTEKTSQSGTSLGISLDKYMGSPNRPQNLVIQYPNHPFWGWKFCANMSNPTLPTSPPHLCITEMATSNCDFRASTGVQMGRFFFEDLMRLIFVQKARRKKSEMLEWFLKTFLAVRIAIPKRDWDYPRVYQPPGHPVLFQPPHRLQSVVEPWGGKIRQNCQALFECKLGYLWQLKSANRCTWRW